MLLWHKSGFDATCSAAYAVKMDQPATRCHCHDTPISVAERSLIDRKCDNITTGCPKATPRAPVHVQGTQLLRTSAWERCGHSTKDPKTGSI